MNFPGNFRSSEDDPGGPSSPETASAVLSLTGGSSENSFESAMKYLESLASCSAFEDPSLSVFPLGIPEPPDELPQLPTFSGTSRGSLQTGNATSLQTGTASLLQTGSTNLLQTGSTNLLQTGSTNLLQTGSTNLLQTGSTNLLQTGTTNFLQTGTTNFLQTGTTNLLQTGTTNFLQTGTTNLLKIATTTPSQVGSITSLQPGTITSRHTGTTKKKPEKSPLSESSSSDDEVATSKSPPKPAAPEVAPSSNVPSKPPKPSRKPKKPPAAAAASASTASTTPAKRKLSKRRRRSRPRGISSVAETNDIMERMMLLPGELLGPAISLGRVSAKDTPIVPVGKVRVASAMRMKFPPLDPEMRKSLRNHLSRWLFSFIHEDLIQCLAFDLHRAIRIGIFKLEKGRCDDDAGSHRIVDDPNLDIFGQPRGFKKVMECKCLGCGRKLQANRYAPHLEKCMGMGRNSLRVAIQRISRSAAEMIDDDDEPTGRRGNSRGGRGKSRAAKTKVEPPREEEDEEQEWDFRTESDKNCAEIEEEKLDDDFDDDEPRSGRKGARGGAGSRKRKGKQKKAPAKGRVASTDPSPAPTPPIPDDMDDDLLIEDRSKDGPGSVGSYEYSHLDEQDRFDDTFEDRIEPKTELSSSGISLSSVLGLSKAAMPNLPAPRKKKKAVKKASSKKYIEKDDDEDFDDSYASGDPSRPFPTPRVVIRLERSGPFAAYLKTQGDPSK